MCIEHTYRTYCNEPKNHYETRRPIISQFILPCLPWCVTCHDIQYIPKSLLNFGHQNKGGCILDMNMFQWVNHDVLQFMSHLFFKQVQT